MHTHMCKHVLRGRAPNVHMESYTSRSVARRAQIGSTQQLPPHTEFKKRLEENLSSMVYDYTQKALPSMRLDAHAHVFVRDFMYIHIEQ